MKKITFDKWVNYNDDYPENELGGLGGWFNSHYVRGYKEEFIYDKKGKIVGVEKIDKDDVLDNTFEDYLNKFSEDIHPYILALRDEIISKDHRFTAPLHQTVMTPLFSDGTVSRFSYRAWGDFMAAVYTTEENPIDYMEYYM